jgi:hypothetical protein
VHDREGLGLELVTFLSIRDVVPREKMDQTIAAVIILGIVSLMRRSSQVQTNVFHVNEGWEDINFLLRLSGCTNTGAFFFTT